MRVEGSEVGAREFVFGVRSRGCRGYCGEIDERVRVERLLQVIACKCERKCEGECECACECECECGCECECECE